MSSQLAVHADGMFAVGARPSASQSKAGHVTATSLLPAAVHQRRQRGADRWTAAAAAERNADTNAHDDDREAARSRGETGEQTETETEAEAGGAVSTAHGQCEEERAWQERSAAMVAERSG